MPDKERLRIFEVGAAVILVILPGLLWLAQLSSVRGPYPAPITPPAPTEASVEVHGSIRIQEPGPDVRPVITMEAAIDKARIRQPGDAAQASSVSARFALVNHVPAWIVTYQGVEVPAWGSMTPMIVGTEMNVVIDATTGEYIQSFSYR